MTGMSGRSFVAAILGLISGKATVTRPTGRPCEVLSLAKAATRGGGALGGCHAVVVLAVEQKAVAAQGKWQTNEIGQPAVPEIDWEQDFDSAKKTATTEHKNVLILFDSSDAKESRFASDRFKEAVAKRDEFHKRADKEFVCVYIDNPKSSQAGRVERR